jgi:hypothetical protein
MLNTKKLLYILPDVTYVTELLPTKKEHTFTIQTFRQINGSFLDDDNLIAENIEKLMSKIEPEEYHLVLPDFLFTNTIVEVTESSEAKAIQYIKEKLLPNLEITKDSHETEISVLTHHQGKYKIQLSALEKEAIQPIASSGTANRVTISGVSPLSWTLKSVISLEPSVSVVQVGGLLYVSLHYIGIDQTTTAKTDEIENVVETIKTLKGGEPSIQTVYLLTNELVETNLKTALSGTLPIQQLATFKEEDTQMPSYVRHIIEAGMKTLDIPDYPVPKFSLPKAATTPTATTAVPSSADTTDIEEVSAIPESNPAPTELPGTASAPTPKPELADAALPIPKENPAQNLPTPTELPGTSSAPTPEPTLPAIAPAAAAVVPAAATIASTASTPTVSARVETPQVEPESVPTPVTEKLIETQPQSTTTQPTMDAPAAQSPINVAPTTQPSSPTPTPDAELQALKQFSSQSTPASTQAETVQAVAAMSPVLTPTTTSTTTANAGIIKNQSGVSPMLRMIFIGIAVFAITVAAGVGITLGVLQWTQSDGDELADSPIVSPSAVPTATPIASVQPTASPTSTATGSGQTTEKTQKVLVVNATTISGHAGKTKTALEKAGYKGVKSGNAKGEYEAGIYVLMKERDEALITQLEQDSGLDLTFDDGITVEDPQGVYDAVIVLAE